MPVHTRSSLLASAGAGPASSRLGGALSVIAATILALGAGELAAALFAPAASPVALVGGAVIDMTPPGVKDAVIAIFGTADKIFLTFCVSAGTLLLAGLVGLSFARTRIPAYAWVLFAGAVALATAFTRTNLGVGAAVPGSVLSVVGVGAVGLIAALTLPTHSPATSTPMAGGATRRRFATTLLTTAGAGIGAAAGAQVLTGGSTPAANEPIVLPTPTSTPPELPQGLDVPGLTPLRTEARELYRIDTALVVPQYRRDTWRLTIDGMVERPLAFTLDELLREPMIEIDATMLCVSNSIGGDLVGSVRFQGIPVRDLLARAGVKKGADQVIQTSIDKYTAGAPLEALTDPTRDALVVLGINGKPLTPEHGAPARLFTPGIYGYVGATKWLTTLTVTTFAAQQGYWVPRGWSALGPVKTATRIDTPSAGKRAVVGPDGKVPVAGVAWAVHRGVGAVQVRADGGAWHDAELSTDVNIDYWRQWLLRLELSPGTHLVEARAADASGQWQTEVPAPPAPNGAAGYHAVEINV